MIEKIELRDYSHTEAIAKIIPALNQVIDHLNDIESKWPRVGDDIHIGENGRLLKAMESGPKDGENYFYISGSGLVNNTVNMDGEWDRSSINFGNYFKTEEQAQEAAQKVKELLLSLKK
jgi:hypothetical protein